jgi:hypothetical protein
MLLQKPHVLFECGRMNRLKERMPIGGYLVVRQNLESAAEPAVAAEVSVEPFHNAVCHLIDSEEGGKFSD